MRRPVCVHPWTKGFPPPLLTGRGCKQPIQSCTNEDTGCVLVISIWDAKSTYLRHKLLLKLFHFRFDSWWFHMILSPPTGFPQPLLQPSCAASSPQSRETAFVQTPTIFSDFPPCCSTAILPNVVTEFTEYKCQSVTEDPWKGRDPEQYP